MPKQSTGGITWAQARDNREVELKDMRNVLQGQSTHPDLQVDLKKGRYTSARRQQIRELQANHAALKRTVANLENEIRRIDKAIETEGPGGTYRDLPTDDKYERMTINGVEARVLRVDGNVVDIQAKLTDKQYQDLTTKFDNKDRNWQTSCFTYLFQSELAAFEELCLHSPQYKQPKELGDLAKNLKTWSGFYAKFEAMVNNMYAFEDPMTEVVQRLQALIEEIKNSGMPLDMQDQLLFGSVKKFGERRNDGLMVFLDKAKKLQGKPPTEQEIRRFMSIQPEEAGEACIGQFLARQLTIMTEQGTEEAFRITDEASRGGAIGNHFVQLFDMHPLLKHLSDAGSYIERKGLSLHGVAANNSRDPVDQGQLETLTDNPNARDDNPTWTSLKGYIALDGELKDAEMVFNQVNPAGPNANDKPKSAGFLMQSSLVLANIAEFAVSLPIRAVTTVGMGVAYGIGRLPALFMTPTARETYVKWLDKKFDNGEKRISDAHHNVSAAMGVVNRKAARNRMYSDELNKLQDPKSGHNTLFTAINGKSAGKLISDIVGGVFWGVIGSPVATAFKFASDAEYRTQSFDKTFRPQKFHQEKIQQFKKDAKDAFKAGMHHKESQPTPGTPDAEPVRRGVRPWARNEFASPVEFFDEIFVGLSDVLLSPMFRKSPGLATIFFILAHASFGAMAAPGLFTGTALSNLQGALMMMSKYVATDFMGKTAGSSLTTDVFTAFLEFKVPLFALEGMKELSVGNGELMKSILANPEKATMSIALLFAVSALLSHVPNMPMLEIPEEGLPESLTSITAPKWMPMVHGMQVANPAADVLNVFVVEAAEVQAHGLYPLTGLEFGFLAFKLAVLAQTMLTSGHDPAHESQHKMAIELLTPVLDKEGRRKIFRDGEPETGQQKLLSDMRGALAAYQKKNPPAVELDKMDKQTVLEHVIGPALKANGIVEGPIYQSLLDPVYDQLKVACQENKENAEKTQGFVTTMSQANSQPAGPPTRRQHLMELIESVQMWEMNPEHEEMDLDTANALYDELYFAFKEYNKEQRKLGNWDKQIDKNEFLHAFNNKFIQPHEKSMTIWAAIRAPFATVLGLRAKRPSDAAHRRNRVKKNAATEGAWLGQIPAMLFRPNLQYAKGAGLVATAFLALPAVGITTAYATFKALSGALFRTPYNAIFGKKGDVGKLWTSIGNDIKSFAVASKKIITFTPEKTEAFEAIKAKQAENVREAGTSSEHLRPSAENIMKQLKGFEREEDLQPGAKSAWLPEGYERQFAEKTLTSSKSKRREEKDLLERYAGGMSKLEKRVLAIEARLNALAASGTDTDAEMKSIKAIKWALEGYKKTPPSGPADRDMIEGRLVEYGKHVENLNGIESNIKPKEKAMSDQQRNQMYANKLAELNDRVVTFTKNTEDGYGGEAAKNFIKKISQDLINHNPPTTDEEYRKALQWISDVTQALDSENLRIKKQDKKTPPGKPAVATSSASTPPKPASKSNGTKPPALSASSGTHVKGPVKVVQTGNQTVDTLKENMARANILRTVASRDDLSPQDKKDLQDQWGTSKIVAVVPAEQKQLAAVNQQMNTQLTDLTEVVENFDMFESNDDLKNKLNTEAIPMEIGDQTFIIKGILVENADKSDSTVLFVKCSAPNADLKDTKQYSFVNQQDLAKYAEKNPGQSFSGAVMMKLGNKLKQADVAVVDIHTKPALTATKSTTSHLGAR